MARTKTRNKWSEADYRRVGDQYNKLVAAGIVPGGGQMYRTLSRNLGIKKTLLHGMVFRARALGYIPPVAQMPASATVAKKTTSPAHRPIISEDMIMPKKGDAWVVPKGMKAMRIDGDSVRFVEVDSLIFIK